MTGPETRSDLHVDIMADIVGVSAEELKEALVLAREVRENKCRSYVDAARIFGRLLEEICCVESRVPRS